MSSRQIRWHVVAAACVLALPLAASAAKRANRPTAAPAPSAEVIRALRSETSGLVDRREALRDLLQDESADVARWQAGYLRDGGTWRAFDAQPPSGDRGEVLEEYRSLRNAAAATFDGQRELAVWCGRNSLPDQQRAHLHAALLADPQGEHPDVLLWLGYRPVGGQWLSPEQLREWQDVNRRTAASISRWRTRLDQIARQLSGPARNQQAGLEALQAIDDPGSIPAIELVLAGRGESSARQAVAALARFPGYEASLALARQGLISPWSGIRQAAAESLRGRQFEDFVPAVISLLSSTIQAEVRVGKVSFPSSSRRAGGTNGALLYSVVLTRETADQLQVASVNTINTLVDDFATAAGTVSTTAGGPGTRGALAPVSWDDEDALRTMAERLRIQELNVERENEAIRERNERIGALLSVATGEPAGSSASAWWDWWTKWNEMESGRKAVVQVASQQISLGTPDFGGIPAAPAGPRGECFAAGTLVWTETGATPIEQIRVGDRVLSKDVDSGALEYKPVIGTTVQPPKTLTVLRVADETIVCTGGHRFWQSGSGWVKARDIGTDALVHTATGNLLATVESGAEPVPTYNLVVADFHTYFVGQSALLSHDVQLPRATNRVVPGLDRAQAAR